MKCGAAVLVGNQTSIPEVVGEAAMLFDPFDVDDISAKIKNVIGDKRLRATLQERGLERAKLFDWLQTARNTLEVYKKAATPQVR